MAILGHSLAHGAGKVFDAVGADAGLRVGSNVGAVNPSKRRRHRKAPGEFLAARTGVTGATIPRYSQVAAALHRVGRWACFRPRDCCRKHNNNTAPGRVIDNLAITSASSRPIIGCTA